MNMKIILNSQNAAEIAQEIFRRLKNNRFTYTIYDGKNRMTERRTQSQLREVTYPIGHSSFADQESEFNAIVTILFPNQKYVMCHSSAKNPTKFDFTASNGDIVIHSFGSNNIGFMLKIEIEK